MRRGRERILAVHGGQPAVPPTADFHPRRDKETALVKGVIVQNMKITVRVDEKETKTSYRPGLNWNEHTDAVFDAVDALKAAVRRCQTAEHIPGYGDREQQSA